MLITSMGISQNNIDRTAKQQMFNLQYEEAEKTYLRGIAIEPNNISYKNELGLALMMQHKYKEAEIVFNKTLLSNPNNVTAIWYSAQSNFTQGNCEVATELFLKVKKLTQKASIRHKVAHDFIEKCKSKSMI